MKRLFQLCLALVICLTVGNAFARNEQNYWLINDEDKTPMEDYALTSGVTVTSDTLFVGNSAGFASLYVIEDKTGGAGDVDIYARYSLDAVNWSKAYISDMAGTTTVEGNIVTAFGNTEQAIVFTARPFQFIQFIFEPDADSEVTIYFNSVGDR